MKEHIAYIDLDFKTLIPFFMDKKRAEIVELKKILSLEKFDQIVFIGHRIKGSGSGYGFEAIGEIGQKLEKYGALKDKDKIEELIHSLENYIQNVEIIYIFM